MLQPFDADGSAFDYLEEDTMKLLDTSDDREPAREICKSVPGRAVLIENSVIEEKAFITNDELPEAVLYYGGEKETDGEHELRMIRISQREEMDRLGMTVSSGHVVIKKDSGNMIGISIGGGGPFCPCLYIVQVFDNTPVSREGTLQSGDELLGVCGSNVKGKTKVEVAKMIQSAESEVVLHYNKLHADNIQGDGLDIALKKIKHRLVENMSSKTADALGLSRAILCNDSLVKRLKELEGTEIMYRTLVDSCKRVLKSYFNVFQAMHAFGTEFCTMSIREPQPTASEAYRAFGEMHRGLEKEGIRMIKDLKPVIANFGTYLNKAIPDTKLTVRKYADSKFAYLSYCLKVKEMDDEEQSYSSISEPLYRVETGNYEYRLVLRCRSAARAKFARLRNDVLEKIELLEAKHSMDLISNLKKLIEGFVKFNREAIAKFEMTKGLFPIEVDLKSDAFTYKSQSTFSSDGTEEEVPQAEEADEGLMSTENLLQQDSLMSLMNVGDVEKNRDLKSSILDLSDSQASLLPEFNNFSTDRTECVSEDLLLSELGLEDIELGVGTDINKIKATIDDLLN